MEDKLFPMERPPLGLRPKFIVQEQRVEEINGAIVRYIEKAQLISVDWVIERNDLLKELNKER